MKKIMIENVLVGISEGGMACGPIGGHVVVEAQLRIDDETTTYYGMAEVDGTANFYKCSESRFEKEIAEDFDDEYPEAEGYCDYDEFYNDIENMMQEDEAHALLLKYLVYLARANWDDIDVIKAMSVGKILGDFEIPVCDVEKEYCENRDDEE